jgi:hypothetical protein
MYVVSRIFRHFRAKRSNDFGENRGQHSQRDPATAAGAQDRTVLRGLMGTGTDYQTIYRLHNIRIGAPPPATTHCGSSPRKWRGGIPCSTHPRRPAPNPPRRAVQGKGRWRSYPYRAQGPTTCERPSLSQCNSRTKGDGSWAEPF